MNAEELFEAWAPASSPWSAWGKPALFASWPEGAAASAAPAPELPPLPEPAAGRDDATAWVVDLPGPLAVHAGLALARRGCRPVPLFNTTAHGPCLVDAPAILRALADLAPVLAALPLPAGAPPAFLLDSLRLTASGPRVPGAYDNRWVVFPQDFPSATLLLSSGVRRVVLLHGEGAGVGKDLEDVLARWREGGLEIAGTSPGAASVAPHHPSRWWRVRLPLLLALATLGLRRNSAGGFGARIPEVTSTGGFA